MWRVPPVIFAFAALIALYVWHDPRQATAAAPRMLTCAKKILEETAPNVAKLNTTSPAPGCLSAGLMADDLYQAAVRQFPKALARKYTLYEHGTDMQYEPRAIYHCAVLNQMVRGAHAEWRRTSAFCTNQQIRAHQFAFYFALA